MAQKKKAQDGSGAAAGTTKSAQAKAQDHQVMAVRFPLPTSILPRHR